MHMVAKMMGNEENADEGEAKVISIGLFIGFCLHVAGAVAATCNVFILFVSPRIRVGCRSQFLPFAHSSQMERKVKSVTSKNRRRKKHTQLSQFAIRYSPFVP